MEAGTSSSAIAEPVPERRIERWAESGRRGANRIADGEVVEVGPSTFAPLAPFIPGYAFTGGAATAYAGVELLVEGGSQQPADATFARFRSLMDASPAKAVAELGQARVQARQDVAYDSYYERAYNIPGFKAAAASGSGRSMYFGGKVYSDGTFFHELGHVAGHLMNGRAWSNAIKADDANLQRLLGAGTLVPTQLGPVEPDPSRRERWTPRLQPGGITGYGEQALKSGTVVEDLAESLRLRTSERFYGATPMATFRDAKTGAERPISFEELYPNRALQLQDRLGPAVAQGAAAPATTGR